MLDVRISAAPAVSLDCISLAHGAGGRASQQLLDTVFRPAFARRTLDLTHDGAVVDAGGARFAFTTDGYVVGPLFFPGGTLGDLAVNGTVNNLAMCGARPLWLSAAFVLEEGLPMGDLRAIVTAMRDAAREAGVAIVTGDTKVVERGKGDGMFITTAGVGVVEHTAAAPERVRPKGGVSVEDSLAKMRVALAGFADIQPRLEAVDLSEQVFPHPALGPFNAYQWMVLLGEHEDRHRAQIERVKAASGFPL